MALIDTSKARPLFNRRMGVISARYAFEYLRGGISRHGPKPVTDQRWNEIILGQESPSGSTAAFPNIKVI